MAKGIYRALNIEYEERGLVFLLIFQSIFIGVFLGAFDVGAHALFLANFEASMIPKAYIVSGLAGILITITYAFLQSRIRFSVFIFINFLFVALVTAFLRLGFALTDSPLHIFLVFIMMGPLNIIALLGFWGTAGRLFTLRQGKRLFGLVDSGQILGIILSSFSIPVLLTFDFQTINLLMISTVSILIALFIQFMISSRYVLEEKGPEPKPEKAIRFGFFNMLKNRYTGTMSLFMVMMVVSIFFITFSFLAVVKENYPDETELTAFLGFFNATLMIFTLLIKTFIYSRFVKTYGLKVAMTVSPVVLLIFTLVAVIIGTLFGYTTASSAFVFFFLLMALSRLFAQSLRDSVIMPSLKVLYQSLESRIRYVVQARVEGTINEVAAVSSGLILTGLGLLAFFEILHFTYVLIVVLILWSVFSVRVYNAYKNSLNESLKKFRESSEEEAGEETGPTVYRKIAAVPVQNSMNRLKLSSHFVPSTLTTEQLIQSKAGGNYLLSLVNQHEMTEALDLMENGDELFAGTNEKDRKEKQKERFRSRLSRIKDGQAARKGIKSADAEDRKAVAEYLKHKGTKTDLPLLNTLLKDHNLSVRKTALNATASLKMPETVPVLTDLLNTALIDEAYAALRAMSEDAIEYLEQIFLKTGTSTLVQRLIVRLYGEIGGATAQQLLFGKLNHHHSSISMEALLALRRLSFRADEISINHIIQIIKQWIGHTAWNMAAELTIREKELGDRILKAIQLEMENNLNRIHELLSLCYDPNTIRQVRKNIESGSGEGVGFAIELMDLFLAEELKPLWFPIIEDTGDYERLRIMQNEFPVEVMEATEFLLTVINRDINLIHPYTKLCAMDILGDRDIEGSVDTLIAQVFNPDPLMREKAALWLDQYAPGHMDSVAVRMDSTMAKDMKKRLRLINEEPDASLFSKLLYLEAHSLFQGLNGSQISGLLTYVQDHHLNTKDQLDLRSGDNRTCLFILRKGSLRNEELDEILVQGDWLAYLLREEQESSPAVYNVQDPVLLFSVSEESMKKLIHQDTGWIEVLHRFLEKESHHEYERI